MRQVIVTAAATMLMATPVLAGPEARTEARLRPPPVSGFNLERHRFQVTMELGFPFFVFQVGYAPGSRVELVAGYRDFYSLTPGAFGGIKIGLFANGPRTAAVSLMALGGWTHLKKYQDFVTALTGGSGGFGEMWLMFASRRGRHAMFVNGGGRVSQVGACTLDTWIHDCDGHILNGEKGVAVTVFADMGYAYRIMQYASFYVALGADMYPNTKQIPGMVRFRTGLMLDF